MSRLGVVEDTLFIPMLGRLYASEHCPQILYDGKALELKEKLPSELLSQGRLSQYTLLASAARSATCGGVPARAAAGAGAGDLPRRGCLCRGLDQEDPCGCA